MADITLLSVLAALSVLAGSSLQSATGFGFGMLATPLLFAATSPAQAVGLMMLLGLENNVLTLANEHRRPTPLGRETVLLLLWSLPGLFAGVAVLRALDRTSLQVIVTVAVLVSLALRRLRPRPGAPPRWALPATGVAAGALNTATSTSGPALVLYLLRRGAPPGQTRDTLTVVFLVFSLLGAAALAATGTTEAVPGAGWVAIGAPLVFAGHLLGRRGFARLAGGRYETVLSVTLAGAALAGLGSVVV